MTASRRYHMRTRNQKYMYAKYIFMTSTPTRHISKPQPQIQHVIHQRQITLTPPHPPNKPHQTIHPQNTSKTQNTPKASQTAELNCLNFKLAVPPHKLEHTQKSKHHQVPVTLNLIYNQATRHGSRRN